MFRSLVFLILISVSSLARGEELLQCCETIRSFGMGGVRIPTTTEPGNMMWNPAYLAFNEGIRATVLNAGGGLNGTQAMTYAQTVTGGSGSGMAALTPFYGKPLWVGGGVYAALAVPYFGLAYSSTTYLDFILSNPAFPNIEMTYILDYTTYLGGALPLGPHGAIGINLKRIVRAGGEQSIGASTLATLGNTSELLDSLQNRGSALAFDLGLMYRLEELPLNPTFGFSWTDVGKTEFTQIGGAAAPPGIQDVQTASLTFDADSLLAGISAGIEYRHINNASEQLGKKVHAGIELSLPFIDVRGGFYQGYTTYGIGMDFWLIQFDLASYTVEKGAYPGQTGDGRIQAGLSMNLGFDPSFNLIQIKGGSGRGVKKRR